MPRKLKGTPYHFTGFPRRTLSAGGVPVQRRYRPPRPLRAAVRSADGREAEETTGPEAWSGPAAADEAVLPGSSE